MTTAAVFAIALALAGAPAKKRSNSEMQSAIAEQKEAFQVCADNYRAPEGRLTMVATIAANGTVKDVRLDRAEVEATEFGRCLQRRAKAVRFPIGVGDDQVSMQFLVAKSDPGA